MECPSIEEADIHVPQIDEVGSSVPQDLELSDEVFVDKGDQFETGNDPANQDVCDGQEAIELANAIDQKETTDERLNENQTHLVDSHVTDNTDSESIGNKSEVSSDSKGDDGKESISDTSVLSADGIDSKTGNTALHVAAINLDTKAVASLLQSSASVDRLNQKSRTAFHEMTLAYLHLDLFAQSEKKKSYMDIVDTLISHGLDVNDVDYTGKTPLHYVTPYSDQTELVAFLLDKNIDCHLLDALQQTALHLAVATGSFECVQMLLNKTHKLKQSTNLVNAVDTNGQTVLHVAARGRGKAKLITLFKRHGAAVNRRDKGGRTALHVAAKAGRVENVEVLMDCGARVHDVDYSGQTPVHYAAAHDITGRSLACMAPKVNSDILNHQDEVFLQTALHMAVDLQMMENIKVLARHRESINPNLQDTLGETPLHKAARCKELFIWNCLVSTLRADLSIPNCSYENPVQKAERARNNVAMAVLAQHQQY